MYSAFAVDATKRDLGFGQMGPETGDEQSITEKKKATTTKKEDEEQIKRLDQR